MTLNSLEYVGRETLLSLRRNPLLSLASALTVLVSLVILGFSVFFMANASNMAKSFESQVEISVFVNKEVTTQQVKDLQGQLESMAGVSSVELVTKEQALEQFGNSMNNKQSNLLENLGGVNPFPDKFTVKTQNAQEVVDIAKEISGMPGVGKVRYGQGVVEKLLSFTQWLRWFGLAVIIAFAVASIVLISINIKMSVFSRRREIQILKLVGASNSFIRGPFLLEGIIIGLVGGILASLLVGLGYNWFVNYVTSTLTFFPIVASASFFGQVMAGLVIAGMGIGAVGSTLSLGKFLKV